MTDRNDTRTILSEMIEITERTIEQTFHRDADLAALYRECPTAFWLAPDGDGVLPPPPAGPLLPRPSPPVPIDTAPVDPIRIDGMGIGIAHATFAAGPIFAATAMMLVRVEADKNWWSPFGRALASLIAYPLTISIGALLAVLPVLAGVLALAGAGKIYPATRRPTAWAATGGAMGVAIAALFEAGGAVALALIATSIACAVVARAGIQWNDPEFA